MSEGGPLASAGDEVLCAGDDASQGMVSIVTVQVVSTAVSFSACGITQWGRPLWHPMERNGLQNGRHFAEGSREGACALPGKHSPFSCGEGSEG
jgi:hypothetical protein